MELESESVLESVSPQCKCAIIGQKSLAQFLVISRYSTTSNATYLVFLLGEDEVGHAAERQPELHDLSLRRIVRYTAEVQDSGRLTGLGGIQFHL